MTRAHKEYKLHQMERAMSGYMAGWQARLRGSGRGVARVREHRGTVLADGVAAGDGTRQRLARGVALGRERVTHLGGFALVEDEGLVIERLAAARGTHGGRWRRWRRCGLGALAVGVVPEVAFGDGGVGNGMVAAAARLGSLGIASRLPGLPGGRGG